MNDIALGPTLQINDVGNANANSFRDRVIEGVISLDKP